MSMRHLNIQKRSVILRNRIGKQNSLHFCCKLVVIILLAGCVPLVVSASPMLAVDTDIATAGYYRLTWSVEDTNSSPVFILQEATTPKFENPEIVYKGPDLATVISGKSNGMYYYRVRLKQPTGSAGTDPKELISKETPKEAMWSQVVSVDVKHHSLPKAIGFFIAGFIVFAATLFMIVSGARKSSH